MRPPAARCPLHYNPDKLFNYEAGIKSQWWDRRITLNASLFLMHWNEIQLESSTSGRSGEGAWWKHGTINGGAAENKGIELSGSARATKRTHPRFQPDLLQIRN